MFYLDNLFRILHLKDVKIEEEKAYKSIKLMPVGLCYHPVMESSFNVTLAG